MGSEMCIRDRVYNGISSFIPSSCNRRTTNIMSNVDVPGRNPHCDSGSKRSRSRYEPRRRATILRRTLSACASQLRYLRSCQIRKMIPWNTARRRELAFTPSFSSLAGEIIRSHRLSVGHPSQRKRNFSARWRFTQSMTDLELRQAIYDRGIERWW